MLPDIDGLKEMLLETIRSKQDQGYDVENLSEEVASVKDSYNALAAAACRIAKAPLREDWPYVEPDDYDPIMAECDPARPSDPIAKVDLDEVEGRVEAAFLGSVCGCILGKPLEVSPTLEEIRRAAEGIGDWPIGDYISEALLDRLGRRHRSWDCTVRERIHYAAPDDDINYTVMGMLLLERGGLDFTQEDIAHLWMKNLPPGWTFGPERTLLVKSAAYSLFTMLKPESFARPPLKTFVSLWNPRDEYCGAQIRADAYGYGCAGRPGLAAKLAWRDASWTHRKTGIYGTMFTSSAIACAAVMEEPLEVFRTALQFVPRRSRFYERVSDCLEEVASAKDWLDGYSRIHAKYNEYGHCRIYQESGTLINTLRFARDVGDGICIQVSQGNDTDSYGATAGSILGMYFGPGHLENRWLAPFNDRIHTALADFHEQSLSALAKRMAGLPRMVSDAL
jgi:ADP-ribosylglycohydrolase